MVRVLISFLLCSLTAAFYGKSACKDGETELQLDDGVVCAPACSADRTCPAVPDGVVAKPLCFLEAAGHGNSFCGLLCAAKNHCPTGADCNDGVCTYSVDPDAAVVRISAYPTKESLFEEFVEAFGMHLSAEEYETRLDNFLKNLDDIILLQSLDMSAEYSHLSPLAAHSNGEFKAMHGLRPELASNLLRNGHEAELLSTDDVPDAYDWRDQGAVTPVKNQGSCGSCWAFATVANIEGVNFLKTQKLVSLSEQELVDCDTDQDQGCNGGLPTSAYKDMIKHKLGLELESDYPYRARDETCTAETSSMRVYINDYKVFAKDEVQIAAGLVQHGPLAIGLNAAMMQYYIGGIADPWDIFCNKHMLDHGVTLVGFGKGKGRLIGIEKDYWIIKNSWGPMWGEKGYYRLRRGKNKCGMATMVSTAIIGSSDQTISV